MNKKFNLSLFKKKLSNFIKNLIKLIRETDKRTLIIGITGVVIALIFVIVIIASVSGGKEDETGKDNPVSSDSYIKEEPSSDDEAVNGNIQPDGAGYYVVSTSSNSSVNMRPTAGTQYSVMATIPSGTTVNVLFIDDSSSSSSTSGWGYIDYNGKRGWVSMDYLKAAE